MTLITDHAEHRFENSEVLTATLAREISTGITDALLRQGRMCIALSGGSTPLPLYQRIAQASRDWSRVQFALVDERWVDTDHSASNERSLREALKPALATGATLTGMKTQHQYAIDGLETCEQRYRSLPLPFDFVLLGMGNDGHIASLFPHAPGLDTALDCNQPDLCAAITANRSEVAGENTERMTLTLRGIRNTTRMILLITGEEKWTVYRQALVCKDTMQTPVAALFQEDIGNVSVWWSP